jgi:hypothetical protein
MEIKTYTHFFRKYDKPRCFEGVTHLSSDHRANKNAQMASELIVAHMVREADGLLEQEQPFDH